MAFSVKKFKNEALSGSFTKDGETLELKIDGDIITPRFLQEIKKLTGTEQSDDRNVENAAYMAKILSRIIVSWDAVENDGITVVPITEDFFLDLPIAMLADLFEFCFDRINPKKTNVVKSESESEDISHQAVN